MKFYDLRHPLTGQVYRLASRILMMPGLPEVRERVLVPMQGEPEGRFPFVTLALPIVQALPDEYTYPTVGQARLRLLDRGWTPAD